MTDSLNNKIAELRAKRVRIRKNIEAAWRIADPADRAQAVHARTLALASTDDEWAALKAEQDARATRIAAASATVHAPARRTLGRTRSLDYVKKVVR